MKHNRHALMGTDFYCQIPGADTACLLDEPSDIRACGEARLVVAKLL